MADYKKLQEAENISIEQPNTYADQLDQAVANLGKPYKYDWNADQLYQDYKKNYMTEAQKAKNNVINAGKQYTAGYPDTYVDSAANQQYQTYLAEINRLAPAFENLAYSQHMMENEDALKQAAMLADLSNDEYARYRDLVGDAQNNRKYEFNNYKYNLGYEGEASALADKLDTANKEYEQKLYLQKIQDAEEAQLAAAVARASGGGGGRGGSGGGGGYGYGGGGGGYTGGDINYSNKVGTVMEGNQPVKVMEVDGKVMTMGDVYVGLSNGTLTVVNGYITSVGNAPIQSYSLPSYSSGTKHGGGYLYSGSATNAAAGVVAGAVAGAATAAKTSLGNYNRSAQERQKNSKRNQ